MKLCLMDPSSRSFRKLKRMTSAASAIHFGTFFFFTLEFVAKKLCPGFRSSSIKAEAANDCTIPQKPMLARQGGCHDMSPGMNLT